MRIKRALLSVYDKTGLVEFARGLVDLGIELISTGGTGRHLQGAGLPIRLLSELTGLPEILDGRVKTLHPAVFASILARREREEDERQLRELGMATLDLVVVNLYPFEQVVEEGTVELAEALEYIDIGGVALLRAAAKNWPWVGAVSHPDQYPLVIEDLRRGEGKLSEGLRRRLAREAFQATASYDAAIAAYLGGFVHGREGLPDRFVLGLRRAMDLRYGENPHQQGGFYRIVGGPPGPLLGARQLHGKSLSYNNLLDLEVAWGLVGEFSEPVASIVKHASPCGVGVAATLAEAYVKAREGDPVSSFGGVVGCNREVDGAAAREIATLFTEAVIAPGFTQEAIEILSRKKNLRLLVAGEGPLPAVWEFRSVAGGLLVQEVDRAPLLENSLSFVTSHRPAESQMDDLRFAWKVVRWAKSNAVVIAKDRQTVGIGAGQPNRVDAVRLAVWRAGERARGAVLASDGFFPFPDSIEEAGGAGIVAIIQPGGSIRDREAIAAAEAQGIAMLFTGVRHFRH